MINNLSGILILVFSQFLPEIFPFSSDAFVVIYLMYLIFYSGFKINKWFISPLILVISFVIFKFFYADHLFTKFFLSDLRPYILLLVIQMSRGVFKNKSYYDKCKLLLLIIVILSFPNFLALFNKGYYVSFISNFYSYRIGGGDYNIAQLAAINGRYSSFFAQPASAAIVFFTALLVVVKLFFSTERKDYKIRILLLICFVLTILNGWLAKSSFFQIGIFVAILIFFWGYNKFYRVIIISVSSFLSILLFTLLQVISFDQIILFFHFATSGRYLPNGNIVPLFETIEWFEYIIGLVDLPKYSKGIGDSSVWMKFAQGGFLYLIFYYTLLIRAQRKVLLKHWRTSKLLFNIYIITLFLGETGFTAFSQPKASLLCLFFIILSSRMEGSRNTNLIQRLK